MKIILFTIFCLFSMRGLAQDGLDTFLNLVEQNNKELQSAQKLIEADKIGFQTGLTPENPMVEYGYFPGNNDLIGTKSVYGISQSFDFPTVYFAKKKLAANQSRLSDVEFELIRQDKLLEAKLKYTDYLFLIKRKVEYQSRLKHSKDLYRSYQTNFDRGNTSVLDLNKARIQNLKIKSSYQLILQKIEAAITELELLAGMPFQQPLEFLPQMPALPQKQAFLEEYRQQQPELRYLQHARQVADQQVKLAQQNWMPEIELAYSGEKEPDGTYRGLRAGLSIPLWKDKKKVQYAKAKAGYQTNRYDARLSSAMNEAEKLYNQAFEYEKIIGEYHQTLEDAANIGFLDKALKLGQMSVIDYFNELAFYYDTIDALWEIEKAYAETLAKLEAYKL